MIVDFHTHVFPPAVIADRERYLAADATFAELYASAKARLATADELVRSMDAAAIDVSVSLGFAWRDLSTCRLHNDFLLESAAGSGGRLVPFCTLPLAGDFADIETEARRCLAAGARGFGELRPENLSFDLQSEAGTRLGRLAAETGAVLLFHVSEPVGHAYAGKRGLTLASFYEFVIEHPDAKVVGAHWGGGLPFYGLMPEVRLALHSAHIDTAASSLLYSSDVYQRATELIGAAPILFGSDFPLLSQRRSRQRIEEAGLPGEATAGILGENARRLLDLK